MRGRLLSFFAGMLVCLAVLAALAVLGLKALAAWTVVTTTPGKVDAIVVLGGDDGSRLRKGLQLYDQGLASRMILVDTKKGAWAYVAKKLCPDCDLEGKQITTLVGSVSTQTDAELSLQYCQQNGMQSVLVVTSPYHTRRAQLVFDDIYGPIGIRTQVVSTDDFGTLRRPGEKWWHDERTLQTVWVEFGKSLYWEVLGGKGSH